MNPSRQPAVGPSRERLPSRARLVEETRQLLLRTSLPRLQMSVLLALTGASGFLTSYILLKAGVGSMALRYPVAVMVAYGVFLLLLRVWLALQKDDWGDGADLVDVGDVADVALDVVKSAGRDAGKEGFSGGGGSFGGGGSSTSFQAPAPLASSPQPAPMAVRSSPGGWRSGGGRGLSFDFDFDLDEPAALFALLALAVLAVAVLSAALWVLWTAPVLLAEVLVDGLILGGLYRRLRKTEAPGHWVFAAIRRTWIPALIVAVLFSFAGHLLQKAAPEARSIGPALQSATASEQR